MHTIFGSLSSCFSLVKKRRHMDLQGCIEKVLHRNGQSYHAGQRLWETFCIADWWVLVSFPIKASRELHLFFAYLSFSCLESQLTVPVTLCSINKTHWEFLPVITDKMSSVYIFCILPQDRLAEVNLLFFSTDKSIHVTYLSFMVHHHHQSKSV